MPGVDVAWNPELGADAREQLEQLFALGRDEVARQRTLNFIGYLKRAGEQLATLIRKEERAGAAIVGILALPEPTTS